MKYLERLKQLSDGGLEKPEKGLPSLPSKPSKAPFEPFEGTEGKPFMENGVMPLPFFEADGGLVIPFGSDPRFHWWNGGQLPSETEKGLRWKH